AKDQEDPIPTCGREHRGKDETNHVELNDSSNSADREIAPESERLANRHHDDRGDEEERHRQLPNRQIDGRAHVWLLPPAIFSPARKARRRVSIGALASGPSSDWNASIRHLIR